MATFILKLSTSTSYKPVTEKYKLYCYKYHLTQKLLTGNSTN